MKKYLLALAFVSSFIIVPSLTSPSVADAATGPLYRDLKIGSAGTDVQILNNFLISRGYLVLPSTAKPTYFGTSTKIALANYQASVHPTNGYLGPITRTYINSLLQSTNLSPSIVVFKNPTFFNQTIPPNTANAKIGSFAIQAGSDEGLQVTNLTVGVVSTVAGVSDLTNLSNLRLVGTGINVIPVNPQATNNFSTNFNIATSQSQIVDVYADIGASSGSASTTLIVIARGVISNVSTTTTVVVGQTITIAQGSVSTTTIVSSGTLPSQYQIGPSTVPVQTYRFVSTTSNATIEELRFITTGTSGSIAQMAVIANGVTYPAVVPVGTTVTFAGLSIPIPVGNAGVNVLVVPTYSTVASNSGIASGSTGGFYMSYMKVRNGNTSTATALVRDGNTASQTQTLVAAKPSLAVVSSGVTLTSSIQEIAQIKITANGGAINIDNLPITIQTAGTAQASSTGLLVKNAAGQTIATATTTVWATGMNGSASGTISFLNGVTTGYTIAAGTTETFRIFATASPGTGTGSNIVSTSLGAANSFTWTDLAGGGTEAGRTGTLIASDSYPSNSAYIGSGSAPAFDFCLNLVGIQTSVPVGYTRNAQGNCIAQTIISPLNTSTKVSPTPIPTIVRTSPSPTSYASPTPSRQAVVPAKTQKASVGAAINGFFRSILGGGN